MTVRGLPTETSYPQDESDPDAREEAQLRQRSHRGELARPTLDPDTAALFARMSALGTRRLKVLREEQCPPCQPGSQQHQRCTHRDDADLYHGLDAFPLCKHAPTARVRIAEKERVNTRWNRLQRAGVRDAEILALVPRSVHSILPPLAWFFDVFDEQRHREASGVVEKIASRRHEKFSAVVLAGAHGTGKSMVAAWGVAEIDRGALWFPATGVEDGDAWRARRSIAKTAELVVIDDLGREHEGCRCSGACWAVEALKSLMTDLLDASIPLVITTNLADVGIFARRYFTDPDPEHTSGTRLRERLAQRSTWLSCGSENLRAHSAAAKHK